MVERLVEATPRAVIDIFWTGAHMAQPGGAHPCLKPLCFSACNLAVDEQAKPFSVAEIGSCVLRLQFGKGLGHTVQPEGFEMIKGWVIKHCVPFNGSSQRHGCWGG